MKVGDTFIPDSNVVLHAISGSRAYGLSTPQSDTDIKGVFILPKKEFYGLEYVEQVNNPTNDIVFYELKRFFELLLKNNPNILELLATPVNSLLYKHPLMERVKPDVFLSKLCRQTFVQYAEAQIKKARGLNKKIHNPVERQRKTVADFCHVVSGQGSVPLQQWLLQKGYKQEECGLVALPHFRDGYAVFHASQGGDMKGIFSSDYANDVWVSTVPKGIEPVAVLSFNKDGYSVHCREYKEYWDWVEKRNENRYQNTLEHGKNYDAKNMMHVFRLLNMAEDIATKGEVIVERPERDFLLHIKSGEFEYDYLLQQAMEKVNTVNQLFDNSALPETPNPQMVNSLLIELREDFYKGV
ncbi:nucleotidyltransferase [bacterium]|nr:MAG: nucleotidyltransferase [bacterium]